MKVRVHQKRTASAALLLSATCILCLLIGREGPPYEGSGAKRRWKDGETRRDDGSAELGGPSPLSTEPLVTTEETSKSHQHQHPVPAVLRNPAPVLDPVQAMHATVVRQQVVEHRAGYDLRLASQQRDGDFPADQLEVFRRVFRRLEEPSSRCQRLTMMGRPKRSGSGTGPEQPVCMDPPLTLATNGSGDCLAYSFGVYSDWSFEEELGRLPCEVHVFDHRRWLEPEGEHAYNVRFHRLGVGRDAHLTPDGGQVLPLDGVLAYAGHRRRWLHYLRADMDGSETDMLLDQLVDPKTTLDRMFVLDRVEQMALQVHLRSQPEQHLQFYRDLDRAFTQLHLLGFDVVFSRRHKAVDRYKFPGVSHPVVLVYLVLMVRKRKKSKRFDPNFTRYQPQFSWQ